jgi:hypothetical protein
MGYAHRISYAIEQGVIPAGIVICHACDNPVCINPNHLTAGTQKANLLDSQRKRRSVRFPAGEANPAATLTDQEIEQIRLIYFSGIKITQRELGRQFGVGQPAISRIVRGTDGNRYSGSRTNSSFASSDTSISHDDMILLAEAATEGLISMGVDQVRRESLVRWLMEQIC